MELLFGITSYIACGYLAYWIVRFFYWMSGCKWNEDGVFLFTALCLGYFALIGFILWISCVLINELLRKIHLNIF